jgi:lysozyme family protein
MDAYKFFEMAYATVIGTFEKGYANDAQDHGGETYNGISRVNNPEWEGWKIIDLAKRSGINLENLKNNTGLEALVHDFYKMKYWNPFQGDLMPFEVSSEMFDIAVNCGVTRAIEFLQRTLNILNKNGKLYSDIAVDGSIGSQTLQALKEALKNGHLILIHNLLNILQGKHYVEIMEHDHTQEKYLGWFARIDIAKL